MGFFDWLFGSGPCCEGNERLKVAIERVIEGTDPRIKGIGDAYERLSPVVAAALHYAHGLVGAMPPCIEMTPEAWGQSPMLRAMFARPGDVANTLSGSHDLREFLGSPQALGIETIHCVVAATRVERTVFGAAMEGDILREDVAQKTVGFSDFRLLGFSPTEELLRTRIEEIVLEGLVLAALRDVAENKQDGEWLGAHRQLLLTRLRVMEQSGAGLHAMGDSQAREKRDIERLRHELAENEAQLTALNSSGSGIAAVLELLIEALRHAESVLGARQISFRLDSMNIVVGAEAPDASTIELIEFSTVNPERPRRVAFLASFPRQSVVERHVDFDAMRLRL